MQGRTGVPGASSRTAGKCKFVYKYNHKSQTLHCVLFCVVQLCTYTYAISELGDLLEHVTTPWWCDLGLALGVDDYTLHCIEHDTRGDCRTGLRRMFQEWRSGCEQPSWDNVIWALRKIGENRLAAEICRKF